MPTNLVASVTNTLKPQLLSRIASAFGLDQAALEKAVAAAVPGLLTAFTSLVAKPGHGKARRRRRGAADRYPHERRQRHRRTRREGPDRQRSRLSLVALGRQHRIRARWRREQVRRSRRGRIEKPHGAARSTSDGRAGATATCKRTRRPRPDAVASIAKRQHCARSAAGFCRLSHQRRTPRSRSKPDGKRSCLARAGRSIATVELGRAGARSARTRCLGLVPVRPQPGANRRHGAASRRRGPEVDIGPAPSSSRRTR